MPWRGLTLSENDLSERAAAAAAERARCWRTRRRRAGKDCVSYGQTCSLHAALLTEDTGYGGCGKPKTG